MRLPPPYRLPLLFLAILAAVGYYLALTTKGTGDTGDSISHYIYARYAFRHPELFLHHWAKPFFVLLTAPFAQLGFVGMKVFNVTAGLLTAWLTWRTARLLGKPNAWAGLLFFAFTPLYMVLVFSGLTEPLFAAMLIGGVYGLLRREWVPAVLLLSFLPFVRSEGLIVIGVVGLYLMAMRRWQHIPLLSAGHLVYGLAGWVYYGHPLWVFTEIPYASLSAYGSGTWYHFAVQLYYVLGLPIYALLILGLLAGIWKGVRRKWDRNRHQYVLIYGMFLAYFAAHSVFWYLGIFNSMGLNRVMIGVLPLMALIALDGYNVLEKMAFRQILRIPLLGYVVLFPFFPNPAALELPGDFQLQPDQELAGEVAEFVRQQYPMEPLYYYMHPYLHLALGVDPFDDHQYRRLYLGDPQPLGERAMVIWDDWFAVADEGVTLEFLLQERGLEVVRSFERHTDRRHYRFVVLVPAGTGMVK